MVAAGLLLVAALALCAWPAVNVRGPEPVAYAASGRPAAVPVLAPDPGGEIDVNTAGAEELTLLPGVGPKLAARIVEEREAGGPFRYPEDLITVSGIGEAKLAAMAEMITLGSTGEER